MDDLKTRIWDYLYQLGCPQTIHVIASELNEPQDDIKHAVDHPWFAQDADNISIAK